jgi:hypothetical protein
MRRLNFPAVMTALSLTLLFAPSVSTRYHGFCSTAFAEELWKQELMDICSKTDEAMSFSTDELKKLLQRCEKLRPVIESLEETPRKVYLKRLRMCGNLYSFVLESKMADKKP